MVKQANLLPDKAVLRVMPAFGTLYYCFRIGEVQMFDIRV